MSNKSLKLQEEARKYIPGVTQLLSKRPEMFAPGQWPGYYKKAKGSQIWDLDDNQYTDMSIGGIGATALGYADSDVDEAVISAIKSGSASSLNCPEEVELAKVFCRIHPWVDMVRYCRGGGEAMSIAVRIARAYSKKDKVAFCGYHGWHDWYISTNLQTGDNLDQHLLSGLSPAGVPEVLKGTSLPFRYNRIDELEKIIKDHGKSLGVIVMEPIRDTEPENNFLQKVRDLANANNIVLIFDEITAAFRLNSGGIHKILGVEPDIAVFAKAISNGYPMAVIAGRGNVMQAAQNSFISSTNWTEKVGPVATIACIQKHIDLKVYEHLKNTGNKVQKGWKSAAEKAELDVHVGGLAPLSHFNFEHSSDLMMRTYFTQRMLELGFLASGRFYSMFAHTDEDVESYLENTKVIFREIKERVEDGTLEKHLKGPVAHDGFKRLT